MAWDTLIIPSIKRGLKVFDPLAQTRALIAKFITRTLVPRKKPWKILIPRRFPTVFAAGWRLEISWLCSAPKVAPTLFRGMSTQIIILGSAHSLFCGIPLGIRGKLRFRN